MPDDWERDGRVQLPDEYAAWAANAQQPARGAVARAGDEPRQDADDEATARAMLLADSAAAPARRDVRFRIVSPVDGDRYAVPAGVPGAYATIALRAAGRGAERVRWFVDQQPWARERWPLTPGTHVVQARAATGEVQTVRIVVDGP
jgi:hypothetical protein